MLLGKSGSRAGVSRPAGTWAGSDGCYAFMMLIHSDS